MQKFDRILFPIDFSPQCVEAVPYVGGIARKFGSEVILLNVNDAGHHFESDLHPGPLIGTPANGTPANGTPANGTPAKDTPANDSPPNGHMEHQRGAALVEFGQAEFRGLAVQRVEASGEPADCIVQCAGEQHADLILMPTHGRSRFRTLLLGSVTSKVLHDAHCPVWTTSHSGLLALGSEREFRTVLCALDLSAETVPVLQAAAQISASFGADLRLIHAIRSVELQPNGAVKDAPFQRFLLDAATERIADLQDESHTNFEVSIQFGAVAAVLKQAVLDFNAQLLTIGRGHIAKPLGRLRTHVATIIRESPCPVLSF